MKNKLVFIIFSLGISFFALSKIPTVFAAGQNLVQNSSVETVNPLDSTKPQYWLTDNWGINTAIFSVLPTGHTGNKSLRLELTSHTDGDSKWYNESYPATAGTKYTVSDYYQSNVQSRVVIMFNLTNGTQQYLELKSAPQSSTWASYSDSVTAPANTVSMSVFHLLSQVGWLVTDDYSVTVFGATPTPTTVPTNTPTPKPSVTPTATVSPTQTPTPTPSPTNTPTPTPTVIPSPVPTNNVVPNPSLETETSNKTMPKSWVKQTWGTNTATLTYLKNQGHTGSHAVKAQLSNYTDGDAKWYFNPVNVTVGDTYTFSDWYKSDVLSHVVVDFEMVGGSHYYLELKTAPASANWKKYTESFQVPWNAKTMTVLHLIRANGWLTTDDYSVSRSVPTGFQKALVTFAFDDGWEEDSINVLPLLNNYGYKGTFFFATSFLEQSPLVGPVGVSGPQTVKAMFAQGHEVGGHTVTHPDLTTLATNDLNYELSHSKSYLESLVGVGNVLNFASPYGAYNDTVISAVKPLYRSHRPTDEGFNTKENLDRYKLKVQNMTKTTTLAQYNSWVAQAVKDKSWLILVYHKVADTDLTEFDTPLSEFKAQMQAVHASGISVKTMNQALTEVLGQ